MGVIAWIAVGPAAATPAAIPATRRWETPGRWDIPEGSS
jgi:hypothetical protein